MQQLRKMGRCHKRPARPDQRESHFEAAQQCRPNKLLTFSLAAPERSHSCTKTSFIQIPLKKWNKYISREDEKKSKSSYRMA